MQENPGCVVTKYQFSQLFSKAWYKVIQPNNLISGFAITDIHPFNSNAISVPTLRDMEVDSEHEQEVAAGEDSCGDLEEMMEEGTPEDNQGVKATAFSPSGEAVGAVAPTKYKAWRHSPHDRPDSDMASPLY